MSLEVNTDARNTESPSNSPNTIDYLINCSITLKFNGSLQISLSIGENESDEATPLQLDEQFIENLGNRVFMNDLLLYHMFKEKLFNQTKLSFDKYQHLITKHNEKSNYDGQNNGNMAQRQPPGSGGGGGGGGGDDDGDPDRDQPEDDQNNDDKDNSNNNNNNNSNNNGNGDDPNDNGDSGNNDNPDENENKEEDNEDEKLEEEDTTVLMQEIMVMRGITNCSGHCGNSLIFGSVAFYKAFLYKDLDYNLFNPQTHLQHYPAKFWVSLISVFEENGQLSDLADLICFINLMWQTVPIDRHHNNQTSSHFRRKRTILSRHRTGVARWPPFDKNDKECWQNKVLNVLEMSKETNRVDNMKHRAMQMFDCIANIYYTAPITHMNHRNINAVDFVLQAILRLIVIHNYRNKPENEIYDPSTLKIMINKHFRVNRPQQSHHVSTPTSDDETGQTLKTLRELQYRQKSATNAEDPIEFVLLRDQIWDEIDYEMIEKMTNDSNQDITLMRLLVITMNFLVESQASLKQNSNITCISNPRDLKSMLQNAQDKHEVTNLIPAYERSIPHINKIFNCNRNCPDGENKILSEDEILAVRLWSDEQVCALVKKLHRDGKSCDFRLLSQLILSALYKLKHNDIGFRFKSADDIIYNGLRDITFDVDKFETVTARFKNEELTTPYPGTRGSITSRTSRISGTSRPSGTNGTNGITTVGINDNTISSTRDSKEDDIISEISMTRQRSYLKNNEDYCLMYFTFTSATTRPKVALKFGKSFESGGKAILLEIEAAGLEETRSLVYGDISWISEFPSEREVLIGPAMLDPYINHSKSQTLEVQGTTVWRYGVTLKGIRDVATLWRNIRNSKSRKTTGA